MEQADWDAFALYFAQAGSKQASAKRRAFLRKQGEEADNPDDETDAYQQTFMMAYAIYIDWRDGIHTLLESLDEQLEDTVFSFELDEDSESETATVTLMGKDYRFEECGLCEDGDGFEQAMDRLEPLLLQAGYSLRVHVESFHNDTLTLLLLPDTFWQRANNLFGPQTVRQHFVRYARAYTTDSQGMYSPAEPAAAPREKPAWWLLLPGVALGIWGLYQGFVVEPPVPTFTCEDLKSLATSLKVADTDEVNMSLRQKMDCQ